MNFSQTLQIVILKWKKKTKFLAHKLIIIVIHYNKQKKEHKSAPCASDVKKGIKPRCYNESSCQYIEGFFFVFDFA